MQLFTKEVSTKNFIDAFELNEGAILRALLKKGSNYHFINNIVKNQDNSYFVPNVNSFDWKLINSKEIDGENSQKFHELILHLKASGKLNQYNKHGVDYHSQDIDFEFYIKTYQSREFYGTHIDYITLMSSEAYIIYQFNSIVFLEYSKLGLVDLNSLKFSNEDAFSFFTRIWKYLPNKSEIVEQGTSHNYFIELNECYRQIMFNVACCNIYIRFTSSYKDSSYIFNSQTHYPFTPTINDNQSLQYLSTAIEEIYTFWERVAYLIYILLDPDSLKREHLSYSRLFERKTRNELKVKFPNLKNEDSNLNWFSNRKNKEHAVLCNYRHPLIHYNWSSKFINGDYNAAYFKKRVSQIDNETEIKKLNTEFDKIHQFINNEAILCVEGFKRAILLIEQAHTNSI